MKKCPICNKSNVPKGNLHFLEVDSKKPLTLEYNICGCSFMYYRFENIAKIYTENNKYINRNTGSGADISFDIRRLNLTYDRLKKHIFGRNSLLDVGCNNGTFLKIIKADNQNISLYGSDIEIGDNNKNALIKSDIEVLKTLNVRDFNKKFDFISVLHVLEHVDDINAFIAQINEVLEDGAKLYIEVPDANRYLDNYFQPFSYFDLEHINHFNIDNLSLLFKIHNFKIIDKYSLEIDMSDNIKYPAIGIVIEKSASKAEIFNLDFSVNNTKTYDYIKKSKNELDNYLYRDNFDGKVLFGVGANTLRTLGLLNKDISKVKYFVDNNPIFHERMVNSIIIKSSNYLLNDKDVPDVIIFSKLYSEEIKANLLKEGFKGKIHNFFS